MDPAPPSAPAPRLTGALLIAVPAFGLWAVVVFALANFYVGNTGFGHGGDSGMLGVLVNMLAVSAAGVVLWLLLLGLQILVAARRALPRFALLASVPLLAISGIAAFKAESLVIPSPEQNLVLIAPDLYPRPLQPYQRWPRAPWAWPLLEPALAPPLFVALGFWALIPAWRRSVPAKWACGAVFGGVSLLSIFVFVV